MTDEQIKQNAVRYQRDLEIETNCMMYDDMDVIHTFIAGAHSRDEEIKELEKKVSTLETAIVTARAAISTQEEIIKHLRNP